MIAAIVAKITDPAERALTERILECADEASSAIESISLNAYEEPDYEATRDLEMWESLASSVRAMIVALIGLKEALFALAPPPDRADDEVDITFDLIEPVPAPPVHDTMKEEVDQLVAGASEMRAAVRPLTDLLVYELVRFGTRLRNPTIIADRWNLLADMQEMKGKFSKLLDALRAALVQSYASEAEREKLFDYRTELDGAIELRGALAKLQRDVNNLAHGIEAAADDERPVVMEELFLRLVRFARATSFQLMRAPDKRLMIEFRKKLAEKLGAEGASTRERQELLDGFVRFLEAMSSINRREVLVRHDKALAQRLAAELTDVDANQQRKAINTIATVYSDASRLLGREPMLDDLLFGRLHLDEPDDVTAMKVWLLRALQRI